MNKKIIWVLIIILFVFSAYIIYQRVNFEKKYNKVELILDYDEILKKYAFVGGDFGDDFKATLLKFKNKGITTIAFNEETIETMQDYGTASVISRQYAQNLPIQGGYDLKDLAPFVTKKDVYKKSKAIDKPFYPEVLLLIDKDKAYIINKILFYLAHTHKKEIVYELKDGRNLVQINAAYGDILNYGLGFDINTIREIKNLGFNIILRPKNKINLDALLVGPYWGEIFAIKKEMEKSFSGIIFGGLENEVLGYPSLLKVCNMNMNDYVKYYKGLYGIVEVAQSEKAQKGMSYLALRNSMGAVRVMSISDLYLAKLTPQEAAEKFALGAKERNIRWLYVHLFNSAYETKDFKMGLMDTNLEFVSRIKKAIGNKFSFEKTAGMPKVEFNFGYIALAIFVFIYGFYFLVFPLKAPIDVKGVVKTTISAIIIIALFAWMFFTRQNYALKAISLFGLINSILFIILAFKIGIEYLNSRAQADENKSPSLKTILISFFIISFITFTAGMTLASLLFKEEFLLNIYSFTGVKLLMILPPIVVFFWYIIAYGKKSFKEIFNWPITWGQGLLLLAVLGLGVYYIIRTGNTPEGAVPDVELSFRSYLADLLVVRPRLKEIFFAHPALILGLSFIKEKKNFVLCALFLLLGCIGQADIIDTFAHAHTPVFISLIRFLYGILFGAIFGVIYYLILKLSSSAVRQ